MADFLWRLKQRKLVQWALAYIAASFALIQVLDVVAQRFGWADRIEKIIILALAVGFFVMLVLAWYHGERGAQKVGGTELLIIALLLAIGGGALWAYARSPTTPTLAMAKAAQPASATAPPAESAVFAPPADSIVVLPFANLGGDPKQQYFSDGITEELTSALGQNAALRVIAWDTASQYRGSKQPATTIGKTLNVANLLHGSIQRENDMVRVAVELVDTRTGYELWSSHYDDSLSNIFQVQDKISAAIADALKVKFAAATSTRTVNPQAHDLVLQANALMERARTAAPIEHARALLVRAVALAPDYAEVHAQLARAWYELTQYSTLPLKEALPKVRAEAGNALALEPNNVTALIMLANIDSTEGRLGRAKTEYQRAIEIDPSNATAHLDYGTVLPGEQGMVEVLEAVRLDPDNATAQNNLAQGYLDLGQYAQALPPAQALLRLDPHGADNAFLLALTHSLLHQSLDAVRVFDRTQPETSLAKALVAGGKLAYQSLLDPSLRARALAAANALRQRTDLDPFSLADVIQLYLTLGEKRTALDMLPDFCAGIPVGCSDISTNPIWLPLHGDPKFEALVKKYDTISQPLASEVPPSSSS